MASLLSYIGLAATAFVAHVLAYAIYNVLFHPLRKFPGPPLWTLTSFFRYSYWAAGYLDHQLLAFHAKYGSTVRYGPDALSFIDAAAWKDIYGTGSRQLRTQLGKVASHRAHFNPGIMDANDPDHARVRKALARAFSDKNVRESQHIVALHVGRLLAQLESVGTVPDATVDLSHVVAEVAFRINEHWGFSHDSLISVPRLEDPDTTVFHFLAVIPKSRLIQSFPRLGKLLAPYLQPSHWPRSRQLVGRHAKRLVKRRLLAQGDEVRFDFVKALTEPSANAEPLRVQDLVVTSAQCIVAGSETLGSALIGPLFWLMRTPDAMQKLVQELTDAFGASDEITLNSLPYLNACIIEGLRLYPPSPSAFARRTPPASMTEIAGLLIPPNTVVGVHQYAAYRSLQNFAKPTEFHPERWLDTNQDELAPFANDNRLVFQPFSYGPRDCAGRAMAWNVMRIVLAKVLHRFKLDIALTNEDQEKWRDQKIFQVWEKKPLPCFVHLRPESDPGRDIR